MALILGIDDSGRGPVIGPMVLAGCLTNEKIEDEFKKHRVRDSKVVPPKVREKLAEIIKKQALKYEVCIIPPSEIDEKLKKGINLNKVEAIYSAEIINRINSGNEIQVIVDCPSNNISAWRGYLLKLIKNTKNISLLCAHKADRDYISVSAASIIAKTTRDSEIEKIKLKLKNELKITDELGSGYTSDPITIEFLNKNFKLLHNKGICRETWQTWKNHNAKIEQKALSEF